MLLVVAVIETVSAMVAATVIVRNDPGSCIAYVPIEVLYGQPRCREVCPENKLG